MAGSQSSYDEKHDPEKAGAGIYDPTSEQHGQHTVVTELEALDDGIPRNKGFFATLWNFTQKLDRFGVEARGIERVPEDMRTGHSVWNCFTVW